VDVRDRAILLPLIFTAARAGVLAKPRLKDVVDECNQHSLKFREKSGKYSSIPVRQHDLEANLFGLFGVGWQHARRKGLAFVAKYGSTGVTPQTKEGCVSN
jgi:hypothetical protein